MKINKLNSVQRTFLAAVLSTIAAHSGNCALAMQDNAASLAAQQQLSTGLAINSSVSLLQQANQLQTSVSTLQQANQTVLQLVGGSSLAPANQRLNQGLTIQLDPNKLMQTCERVMEQAPVQEVLSLFNGDGSQSLAQQPQQALQTLQTAQQDPAQNLQVSSGLSLADQNLNQSLNQLSTGLRINTAQDLQPQDLQKANLLDLGAKLDFMMLSQGFNDQNGQGLSIEKAINQDQLKQQVASIMGNQLNSPYFFQCFQTLWNGNQQQVLQLIGNGNSTSTQVSNSLLATPEPAMPLTFTACLGLALVAVRKNRKQTIDLMS